MTSETIDNNAVDKYGGTPLLFACIYGQCNVVKFPFESKEQLYDLTLLLLIFKV